MPTETNNNSTRVELTPFVRSEGDLRVNIEIENGKVTDAICNGVMFRGFEIFLRGKKPTDAVVITPRICGICAYSHSLASVHAVESAFDAEVPENALLIRNVVHGLEHAHDPPTWLYALFAIDFVNKKYAGHRMFSEIKRRFSPFTGSSYVAAVKVRKKMLQAITLFSGRWTHSHFTVPGGVTCRPTLREITKAHALLTEFKEAVENLALGCSVERWLENKSLKDVQDWLAEDERHANSDLGLLIRLGPELGLHKLGVGPGKFLSYGVYDEQLYRLDPARKKTFFKGGFYDGEFHAFDQKLVNEHAKYSHAAGYEGGKHPLEGITEPRYDVKEVDRSWSKQPRYGENVAEVGALARQINDKDSLVLDLAKAFGPCVFTRALAKLHEGVRLIPAVEKWLLSIDPDKPFYKKPTIPRNAEGIGLTEAPRGALGHWIRIKNYKIENYQVITPTAWNSSTRDSAENPGAIEQALIGTPAPDIDNLIEVQHVVRSFDPCLVCTVHAIEGKKRSTHRVDHFHGFPHNHSHAHTRD